MRQPDEYLPHTFRQDVQELKRTRELVADVAQTFGSFVTDHGWPYELKDQEPAPKPSDSQSTNAMILFALAAAAGKVPPNSPLLPADIPGDIVKLESGLWSRFEEAWTSLLDEVRKHAKYKFTSDGAEQSHVSWSSSFGWDDPFTLTWLCELDRSGVFASGTGKPIRDLLHKRSAVRVREGFEFKNGQSDNREGPFLTWRPAPDLSEKDKEAIGTAEKTRTGYGNSSLDHAFPLLRFVQLGRALRHAGVDAQAPDQAVCRSLQARVHEQLSKAEIADGSFDPSELVFALEGTLILQPNLVTRPLLERALGVITRSQAQSPYWRPVKPFVSRPQGHVLFAVSVETASSLLRCCALASKYHSDQTWFTNNVGLFAQYVEWLRTRHRKGSCPSTSGAKSANFRGWHSEHVHLHQGIHLWETSQVLLFLVFYAAMLDRHIAEESLRAANLTRTLPWKPGQGKRHLEYWDDRDVGEPLAGLATDSRLRVFDGYARQHLILPRPRPDGSPGPIAELPHFSALLYGPPGTGKTSFAEEVCKALRWPLITITPSDFIHGGESQIEARAKQIFEVLEAQREVVVLFDEIDRLILDRDSALYAAQGDLFQFMTPSMLTKLRDLRKKKRVIFLIATNYEERIDAAIKRRGRIDAPCLVAPPDQPARNTILLKLLNKHLESQSLSPADAATEAKLARVAARLRLMVYGELKQFFDDAVTQSTATAADIVEELDKRAEQAKPAIRLLAYRSRVTPGEADGQGKQYRGAKPLAEFFLLTYLRIENGGQLDEDERKLVFDVLNDPEVGWPGKNTAQRKLTFGQLFGDAGLADRLVDELERLITGRRAAR